MKIFQILLYPLSILYNMATGFRNHLYNIHYKPTFHFETITISVGNLSVGGTGKSPMIEYLIRLLKDRFKVATLSRGYGRRSKGFKIADNHDDATSLGDEPFQFYLKFGKEVTVTVGEERAVAIPEILYNYEETEVVLLDDAYQHRTVERDINILLTTFDRPFFDDLLLPAGRLREAASGAKRADIVIVTKCPPDMSTSQKQIYKDNIYKYASPGTPVFYSVIEYADPMPVFEKEAGRPEGTALLVSGLAHPGHFVDYSAQKYKVAQHLKYKDHHNYTLKDAQEIRQSFDAIEQPDKFILTTEKDMVKFLNSDLSATLQEVPVFYLPIEMKILEQSAELDNIILDAIKKRKHILAGNSA